MMYPSPSMLSEQARRRVIESLNARLADGLDLHSHIKVAHWNIRGPQFPSAPSPVSRRSRSASPTTTMPLPSARSLSAAKRTETARHVAGASALTEYPRDTTPRYGAREVAGGSDRSLLDRSTRIARKLPTTQAIPIPPICLTSIITEFEKHELVLAGPRWTAS